MSATPTARCNRLLVRRHRVVSDAWGWCGGAVRLERSGGVVTSSAARDNGTLCNPFFAEPGDMLVWSPGPADPSGVLDVADGLVAVAERTSVLMDLLAGNRPGVLSGSAAVEEALRRTARAAVEDWLEVRDAG